MNITTWNGELERVFGFRKNCLDGLHGFMIPNRLRWRDRKPLVKPHIWIPFPFNLPQFCIILPKRFRRLLPRKNQINQKKWNRDLLAVSNFQRIWNAYIHGRERPDDLRPRRRENEDNPGDGDGNVQNDNAQHDNVQNDNVQNDNVQNGNTGAMEVVQNNIVQAGFVMYRGV
jgi:hypothetical protein